MTHMTRVVSTSGHRFAALLLAGLTATLGASSCTNEPDPYTSEQLDSVLLTSSDLSDATGLIWTETQRMAFDTREAENPSIDPSLWCPAGRAANLVQSAGDSGVDVELVIKDTDSPYMIRQQAWSNGKVRYYFSTLSSAVSTCSGVTWNDDEGNTYLLEPNPTMPRIGDESVSWNVTITLAGAPEGNSGYGERTSNTTLSLQTVARFGEVIMIIQGGAITSSDSNASAPNYTILVRAAGDKMSQLD